jgi:hypothetical protein
MGKLNKYGKEIYSGKGLDKNLEGVSYGIYPRELYGGAVVTPENRRSVEKVAYVNAMEAIIKRDGIDEDGITDIHKSEALRSAKRFVNMSQKSERKHLRGDMFMKYKGDKLMIPTEDNLARAKQHLEEFQRKAAESALEEE